VKLSDHEYRNASEGRLLQAVRDEFEMNTPEQKGTVCIAQLLNRSENHIKSCMKDEAHLSIELWMKLEAEFMVEPHFTNWLRIRLKNHKPNGAVK